MVLFLYGDDINEIQYKYRQILNRFQEKNKDHYTLQVFSKPLLSPDQEQPDVTSELLDFLKSSTIFNFKKIAIISNFEQLSSKDHKKIYNFLNSSGFFKNKQEFLLIRYNGSIKTEHKQGIANFLKQSIWQKFELPSDYKSISRKIIKLFSRAGLKLEVPALSFLTIYFKNSVELISKELERIIPFFIYRRITLVTRQQLEKLVFEHQHGDVFSFLEALLKHDYKTIFQMLDYLVKEDEIELFIYQLRSAVERIILIKSISKTNASVICRKLKLHPYYYKKLLTIFKNHSLKQLKKIYQHCWQYSLQKEQGQFRNQKLSFSLFVFDELFHK